MHKTPVFFIDTKKFKICFINKFDWLGAAPMATVSVQMSHALATVGNDVTLYISGTTDLNSSEILESKYALEKLHNLNLEILSKSKFIKKNKISFYFYLKAFLHIIKKIRNCKEKLIIISRNTHFIPFMFLIKKITGAMTFFETHSFHNRAHKERKWLGVVPHFGTLQSWLFEKIFLPHLNGLICITRRQIRLYKLIAPSLPSVYLPLGSPKPEMLSPITVKSRNPTKLLYCGRLTPYLDVITLIKALYLCKNSGVTLTWFGLSEKDKCTLISFAKKFNVADSIFAESWISHKDLLKRMKTDFGIGLATYDSNFISSALTCPTKIFDYFAAGLPVIGSSIGTVKDILTNGREGLLYIPEDSQSLHNCIEKIKNDKELYFTMQKNCLKSAERFSWINRARNFVSFVESCYGR